MRSYFTDFSVWKNSFKFVKYNAKINRLEQPGTDHIKTFPVEIYITLTYKNANCLFKKIDQIRMRWTGVDQNIRRKFSWLDHPVKTHSKRTLAWINIVSFQNKV